jgi:NAD(P)-dependent dehydrogenase (short-subunit alcohol dehydrogenase family)
MQEFLNHVIIVTGAARGIGRVIADTLSRHGAHVVIADIAVQEGQQAATAIGSQGGSASFIELDITDPLACSDVADRVNREFGRIDALVNNAGLDGPRGRGWEIDDHSWTHVINVDLNGPWRCTRAVIPKMMEQRRGRVVFISSIAARVPGAEVSPAYAAAKAGLIGLTVALSAQLEPYGILVNAIMPGATGNTGYPTPDAEKEAYLARHPLGFGGPQPIADGVLYLLGSSGNWTSGAALNISGGNFRGI